MTAHYTLAAGDLAYWLDEQGHPVRCRVELVTDQRIYLRATADDHGHTKGSVWFTGRYSRRVAPREAVYVHKGKGHFDWTTIVIVEEGKAA